MKCKICNFSKFDRYDVSNPQNTKEIFTYYFCKKCEVGYLFDIDKKNLSLHYNEEYNEYQDNDLNKQNILDFILEFMYYPRNKFVKNFLIKNESIFDVGCGNGSFLFSVKHLFKKIYGSDYNKFALSKAKIRIKNLNIVEEDLNNFDTKVDVITMWHVLEHINEPQEFLNKVKKLMHSNSRLILEVPNSRSLNFRIFKKNYLWISLPEHVFFYNEKSLKMLFDKTGFELVSVTFPRMFPLLFSNHFNSLIVKILLTPISISIFALAPFLKSTESLRIVGKLK